MPPLPIAKPPKSKTEWTNYVERAKKEIIKEDKEYAQVDQSDHPGCQVVVGITNTGNVSTTGYVECGVKLERRVTKVPSQ